MRTVSEESHLRVARDRDRWKAEAEDTERQRSRAMAAFNQAAAERDAAVRDRDGESANRVACEAENDRLEEERSQAVADVADLASRFNQARAAHGTAQATIKAVTEALGVQDDVDAGRDLADAARGAVETHRSMVDTLLKTEAERDDWKRRALTMQVGANAANTSFEQATAERDAARLLVEDLMKAEAKLRTALGASLAALNQIPTTRRSADGKPPASTCLGCGRVDSQKCKPDCWVPRLEAAADLAEDALAA